MNYYDDQFQKGKEYEQFIINKLKEHGITLTLTKNFNEQINIGETYEGYEIKFDDKYRDTHNIWIETEERTDPEKQYVDAGINRKDNTIKYVIGDYERIFIFKKSMLKELMNEKEIRENNMKTSKGFLLTESEAFRYSDRIVEFNTKQISLANWVNNTSI